MPESAFCSQMCWLGSLQQIEAVTAPKFLLGQFVACRWFDEECQAERIDRGQIIGLALNPPASRLHGWWYSVRLTDISSHPWLSPGYIEEIHESELEVDISATH